MKTLAFCLLLGEPCIGATDDWYLGWLTKARHGPPHVGTIIWTNRAALGAGGRNGTDRIIPRRDDESHRAGQ